MEVASNPVCWFEIPTADLKRAIGFYEHVFDVTLEQHEMGPLSMAWFPMNPHFPFDPVHFGMRFAPSP